MPKHPEPKNDIPWELQDAEDCHEPLNPTLCTIGVAIGVALPFIGLILLLNI